MRTPIHVDYIHFNHVETWESKHLYYGSYAWHLCTMDPWKTQKHGNTQNRAILMVLLTAGMCLLVCVYKFLQLRNTFQAVIASSRIEESYAIFTYKRDSMVDCYSTIGFKSDAAV